ncbi:predicted transcriptional regulator [Sanguibacter keddieii DSM 10542]|uniref:Predicted transcriptional regulator n=1 Tax=Sanguibacter keddieii (strain ATCC 51767 / DSM 10542 / NCFB 3025 / ST-74) TaxID=446469 RepID=D1BBP9_SANKS|nr:PadR family transcriptional regulator [Sanguibacter keddieii]ACZ22820.1 predicted transcriptional regulator [Sanguibacter keddieii DSM 10542]
MTAPHDTQLLKGVLPTLVLAALAAGESYGYELVTRLQAAGLGSLTTGTVYPVLTRLERDGLLAAHLVPSTSGPARKYYRPTPAGHASLTDGVAGWTALDAVVRALASGASPASSASDAAWGSAGATTPGTATTASPSPSPSPSPSTTGADR